MSGYRSAVLAAVLAIGSVSLAPLTASAASPVAAAGAVTARVKVAAAATGSILYVKPCSTSGDGSWTSPFCTLAAAAAAVQPGQTVTVEPGDYEEALNITRSGTSGAPITFQADNHYNAPVYLSRSGTVRNVPLISVSGAHDVVVRGFNAFPVGASPVGTDGVLVSSSSNVTIDQGVVRLTRGQSAVHVTGTSNHVTISRVTTTSVSAIVGTTGPGILVDAGVTGVVVTGDVVESGYGGISVTGSPGSVITGNTVLSGCHAGITLGAGSPSSTLENNVVEPSAGSLSAPKACPAPVTPAITVAGGSTSQTVADYNLIDPAAAGPLYSWGGTDYADLGAFRAATGQGTHDVAADPQLTSSDGGDLSWLALGAGSPALDSANVSAPGELAADLLDNGRADDPDVANTGTGIGYADRGAVENVGTASTGGGRLVRAPGGGPLDGLASSEIAPVWAHTGAVGLIDYSFSDGAPDQVTHSQSVAHTFARAGLDCSYAWDNLYGFRSLPADGGNSCTVFGADYTPLAASRILDTKHAIGVSTTTPLAAGGTVTLPVAAVGSVPAAQISALVLNVTVSSPTAAGGVTLYGAGTDDPKVAGVNFAATERRSNLLTVPLTTGITVHNTSKGTVHVTVDLHGYYSAAGSGFKPLAPVRVLDTSTGTGAPKQTVPAKGSLALDLTAKVPASVTAAVLNVTVTSPSSAGGVAVYPTGQAVPAIYDVAFPARTSVTSQVLASVAGGKITFYNNSSGTVQIAADLTGFFGPASSGATESFVPYGPVRLLDTGSTAVKAKGVVGAQDAWLEDSCVPTCPLPATLALTITASSAKAGGTLIAYPNGATRPGTPNVTYGTGLTVSDSATVISSTVNGSTHVYNNSTGTVRIFVDEQGYYIPAA